MQKKQVILGELHRRHNNREITNYPVYFDGYLLFDGPKGKCNSWEYEVWYRLGGTSEIRKVPGIFDGANHEHVAKEFIVWITNAMWLGDIPAALSYNIKTIKRTNHRRAVSPNDP